MATKNQPTSTAGQRQSTVKHVVKLHPSWSRPTARPDVARVGPALSPLPPTLSERLQAAVAAGALEWGGGQFRPEEPTTALPDGESLVEALLADRGG